MMIHSEFDNVLLVRTQNKVWSTGETTRERQDKPMMLQRSFNYKWIECWIEKSTTKGIALVEKIDNMLRRQLVNALDKQ